MALGNFTNWLIYLRDDYFTPRRDDFLIVLLLCLVKMVLMISALLSGAVMLMNDEPVRWGMSLSWVEHPSFAPWDHVWLGGFFYFVGTYLDIFGQSYDSAKLLVMLVSLLSVAGAYGLGKTLFESRYAGFLAALLTMGGYIHTWLSISLMPGPPFGPS